MAVGDPFGSNDAPPCQRRQVATVVAPVAIGWRVVGAPLLGHRGAIPSIPLVRLVGRAILGQLPLRIESVVDKITSSSAQRGLYYSITR